jgi:hypothetical protein
LAQITYSYFSILILNLAYIYSLACMIYVIFFVICCILVIRLISMFNKVEKTLSSTVHPRNFSSHNYDKYMIPLTCFALLELA